VSENWPESGGIGQEKNKSSFLGKPVEFTKGRFLLGEIIRDQESETKKGRNILKESQVLSGLKALFRQKEIIMRIRAEVKPSKAG